MKVNYLMDMIKSLLLKYKGVILYLVFGVLTTVINVITYHISYEMLHIANITSTMIAWVVAVTFAYFTNKLFVFESKRTGSGAVKEAINFFACRIGTGVIEVGMMYVFVDILALNGTIMKLITNFIVIVINYIASKFIIFNEGKKHDKN